MDRSTAVTFAVFTLIAAFLVVGIFAIESHNTRAYGTEPDSLKTELPYHLMEVE